MRHSLGPQNDPVTVFPTAVGDPIALTDDGLVMGDGSILVRMSKGADPGLALDDDGDRFTALMSVVGGRAMPADAIRHVEAADAHWRRGDKALANLRLILADLPRLATPADACRLTLAAHLLDEGMAPTELMTELGFLAASSELEKYSRDQPRVSAGHGHESGEFGSGGGSRALLRPPGSAPTAPLVVPAGSSSAIAALQTFLMRLGQVAATVVRVGSGPAAFVTFMVVPTPNSGGVSDGTLPDMPDVAYHKDVPAGTLRLTTQTSDGSNVSVHARSDPQGVYFDSRTGQVLGHNLGTSMALDKTAVRAALDTAIAEQEDPERKPKAATDEPEVCPAPEKDRGHGAKDRALDYEEDVHGRVNPVKPLDRGEAVRVWSPMSGKDIYLDDCYRHHGDLVDRDMKPGDLADAKGPGYDHAFAQVYGPGAMEKLVYDTRRQQSAADFRSVRLKLYFAEKGAADLVRKRFGRDEKLSKVVVSHMPPRKGH